MAWFFPWMTIVPEYQRAAVFRLGRITGYRGPGMILRLPLIEKLVVVDRRIITVDVPSQECISKDNIPMRVNAVVYFRVEHPDKAIVEVLNYRKATIEIAQTTLRSVIGQRSLDELLSDRDAVASALQALVDEATDAWGVKVSRVEIKDLEIPDGLKRAMAKEAEAERERRAMVIRAQGEKEAATQLAEAAKILDSSPTGFRMRYLQTLVQVAERGNTVVFAPQENAAAAMAAAQHQQAIGKGRVTVQENYAHSYADE